MPLRLVRSASNATLWESCVSRFLDELDDGSGPDGYPSHLWLVHRAQRDRLLAAAAARGLPGWLAPPFSFLSELRERFGIRERPIGILAGRLLVARIAARAARRHGFQAAGRGGGPARGHMLDRVLSELLPEGVRAEQLEEALEAGDDDDGADERDEFARRRDAWLVDTYRGVRDRLAELGRYDPRSIHAMVAERIEEGGLRAALRGAERLHVYGLTSLRGRRRLFRALAAQEAVEVVAYLPDAAAPDEWDAAATGDSETIPPPPRRAPPAVQPVPDAVREAGWVAGRVKRLLVEGAAAPHEIAVVARSGRDDTRRIHRALERVGVPSTARLRSPLAEIPVLRTLLLLLDGEAEGWPHPALRAAITSPYLDVGVDPRPVDHLATVRRPHGLEAWLQALCRLGERANGAEETARRLSRAGIDPGRLARDLPRLEAFAAALAPLREERSESGWIDLTLAILRGEIVDLRRRLCRPAEGRWDVVRLDQRGVLALEGLLREWRGVVDGDAQLPLGEWRARLGRLLETNELALSTPLQTGVQVLEAHEAALAPFRYTFLVHANHGVFPRAAAAGGVFTEAERRRLRERGLPLSTHDEAMEREHRLWRGVANGGAVTITYRTTDAKGVPRLPSLLVPEHDPARELPRTLREPAGPEGEGTPRDDETAASRAEALARDVLRLAARRRAGDVSPLRTPDPDRVRHAVLGAFAEALRRGDLDPYLASDAELVPAGVRRAEAADAPPLTPDSAEAAELFGMARPISERPTAWAGRLRDPFVLDELERRFGDEHEWSASQLEAYGRRPFDFLLQRVLRLEERETAEREASRRTVGGLVHGVLERFYHRHEGTPPGRFDDEAAAAFESAFAEACAAYEEDADEWLGVPHVWAATREELRERLLAYLSWELDGRERWLPVAVELAFGWGTERGPVDLSGRDLAGVHRRLLLAGRIDRVDRVGDPRSGGLRVVDYKSGGSAPAKAGYEDGAALQSALYMAAVERLGLGRPTTGVYRPVKRPGNRTIHGPGDVEAALRIARSIPPRVRRGVFEPVQAGSTEAGDWQPGRDIVRTDASISGGTRFLPLAAPVRSD